MSFITQNVGQFPYFDMELGKPEWPGKKVLDFGGNTGNILHHQNSTIDHDNYWCIDVSRDAIEAGSKAAPRAHFVFYNRFNPEYNPRGIRDLPIPATEIGFDFILALSVFTHTSKAEMIELVRQLGRLLNDGGRLAFTFFDPHYIPPDSNVCNLKYYFAQRSNAPWGADGYDHLEQTRRAHWCTLAGGELRIDCDAPLTTRDAGEREYLVFYTPDYLKSIFPQGEILAPVFPFARQHCCVITHGGAN